MSDSRMCDLLWLAGVGLLGVLVGHWINKISHLLPRILEAQWQQEVRKILGLSTGSSSFRRSLARYFEATGPVCPARMCGVVDRDRLATWGNATGAVHPAAGLVDERPK